MGEGRCKLRQALIKDKRLPELMLLPASQKRDKSAVHGADMIRLCDDLKPENDFILIDSAAGIEEGFRTAIAPADEVVIVTNPEVSAVRDADRIIGLIEAEEKGPARLVINRIKPEMVRRGDMLAVEDVLELDEVWSFVLKKENRRWIWVALCRRTRQSVAYFIGDHSEASCLQLW